MNALSILGIGCVALGLVGTGVTVEAGRQIRALPRAGCELAGWPNMVMIGFIGLVDIAVTLAGVGVAMLER